MNEMISYIKNLTTGQIIKQSIEIIAICLIGHLAVKLYAPTNEFYNPTFIFVVCVCILAVLLSIVYIVKKFVK